MATSLTTIQHINLISPGPLCGLRTQNPGKGSSPGVGWQPGSCTQSPPLPRWSRSPSWNPPPSCSSIYHWGHSDNRQRDGMTDKNIMSLDMALGAPQIYIKLTCHIIKDLKPTFKSGDPPLSTVTCLLPYIPPSTVLFSASYPPLSTTSCLRSLPTS